MNHPTKTHTTRRLKWTTLTALAVAMLLTVSTGWAEEVGRLTSSHGPVKSGSGDCVKAVGGDVSPMEACGDVMAEPAATLEVVTTDTAATVTATVMEKVTIAASMLFGFDSAELSDDAKAVIDERIQTLAGQAKLTSVMRVEGHTDSTGPEAYNLRLSQRRAQAVADYIASQAPRVAASDIEVVGKGEADPVASNDTREGRAENRRVDIFAQGEVSR